MKIKYEKSNVAIWGPSGSGKTTLIRAFVKELAWYNDNDPDFSYSIRDSDNNRLDPSYFNRYNTEATTQSEDYVFIFERRGKIRSAPHQINSHSHNLIIHDGPGSYLIDVLDEPHKSLTRYILENTESFIIMLDPTSIKGSPITGFLEGTFTQIDYQRMLLDLVNLINASRTASKKVNVAVCLCKSDLIKIHLPTDEIIKVIFGSDVLRILNMPILNVKFFKVSSVGTIMMGGKKTPNISEDMISLRDDQAWNPVNVVSPFFWIFEIIEKERIEETSKGIFFARDRKKMYIPYPPTRPT